MWNPLTVAVLAWVAAAVFAIPAVRIGRARSVLLLATMVTGWGLGFWIVIGGNSESNFSVLNMVMVVATYSMIYLALLLPSIILFSAVTAQSKSMEILLVVRREPGMSNEDLVDYVVGLGLDTDREERLETSVLTRQVGPTVEPSAIGSALLKLTGFVDWFLGDPDHWKAR